jgi:hypothetical protein
MKKTGQKMRTPTFNSLSRTKGCCTIAMPGSPQSSLHFNVFIAPGGAHESAWRLAGDDVRGVFGPGYYAEIGRIAERGLRAADRG